jgi:outer membrane lipoprotein LolB
MMPWSTNEDTEVLTFLPANQLDVWDMTAKFSVTSAEGTESGTIRWIKTPASERLDILSPTGSVVARLTIDARGARLATDDEEYVAKDADTLLADVVDVSLPVDALRFWVRGLDAPNLPIDSVSRDNEGRVTELSQNGWQLTYNGSVSVTSGSNRFEVPRRLTAARGDFEIRWASTEWQIPNL